MCSFVRAVRRRLGSRLEREQGEIASEPWEDHLVRRLQLLGSRVNFLSILRECSSVAVYLRTIEVLVRRHSFSEPVSSLQEVQL